MFEHLKRIAYAILLAFFCAGFVAVVVMALTPQMVIGEGRLNAFIRQVEVFDFKWWITGFAFALWFLPILLLITYQRAQRAGQEVHDFRGLLRRMLANQKLPVLVDIDQKIPIQLDGPLDVPVELHTQINIDSDVDLQAEVPIRTELPIETKVQTNVLGLGTISIPIQARVPIDVVVPIKGRMRVKATGVPVDIAKIGVVRLAAIEIPVRARIQAKIDLLGNLDSAESFLTNTHKGLLDKATGALARLWHALFK